MAELIEPLEKEITIDGVKRTFIISKLPAIAGREILTGYPMTAMPKIGDRKINEELMLKLISYVAIKTGPEGHTQRLSTRDLIDNHVPSWEMLMHLEKEMITYNCSFFRDGRLSTFLSESVQKLPQWISKTLTASLAQLSPAEQPPSTN